MSNNQPSVFNFEESIPIRVITISDEQWFVGKDVCLVLGYTNPAKAMSDHCKGITKRYPLATAGGKQEIRILSEADVMRLICGSKLPAAQKFERWVFEEVLPAIRRTGRYAAPVQPELPLPDRAALPSESRSGIVPRMEYNGVAVMPIWEIARATGRTLGGLNTRKHDCNYDLIEGTDVFRGVIITPELRKNAERAGYQLCARASIANFYTATGVESCWS